MTSELQSGPAATQLQTFAGMLGADGYEVSWAETAPGKLELKIEATEGACAECLVGKPVMQQIVNQMLTETSFEVTEIVYPS